MGIVLRNVLEQIVRRGDLVVTHANGATGRFGDGTGPTVRVRFTTAAAERGIVRNPELKIGEAYMDGGLVVDEGSIYDFLMLVSQTDAMADLPWWVPTLRVARYIIRRLHQFNPAPRARRNVHHHYDLDSRLYDLFLDKDSQYSCAYFENSEAALDEAQLAKKRHLAAKLALEPGQRVLDIGSGWGGLALYLAGAQSVDVTGVTLSEEQLAESRRRARDGGLDRRVDFRLADYRALDGRFDRIVSVGMFEHVGVGYYNTFFRKVRDLLSDDGVMVLHSIGRFGRPGATNPWIEKYIFPGGYIPALSEVIPAIERSGLLVTDVEILRLHYAETLRHWRERFLANRNRAQLIYDDRFCRMWEFYLAGSEVAFRTQSMMVFQIQLTRQQTALPLTRNYISDNEAALRAGDEGRGQRSSAAAG